MLKKFGIVALFLLGSAVFFSTHTALAVSDDFNVRSLIGEDTEVPTTPGNFTAIPVALSQINLSWTASTDDFILSGYHVWRDGVQVGTTSATSYIDTGLTASTTYTYYVTAYDSFFNESASSTLEATTTLGYAPPEEDSQGSRTGSKITPFERMLTSIEILPQKDSVTIRYVTEAHVRGVIKWGKTSSYELGSLAEQTFGKVHQTFITGLTPGSTYVFVIEGENKIGRYGTIYEGTFSTLPPEDTFAPGNISDFTAKKDGTDILLTWTNPNDLDFEKVRILESEQFYPSDTADGWVVYEGDSTSARSKGKALPGTTHYYTIFAYDALGNISSGAVAVVTVDARGIVSTSTTVFPTNTQATTSSSTPAGEGFKFTFEDIKFSQEGELIGSGEDSVFIQGSKQLTISIPYETLPEHLKTILVVLESAEDSGKQFTFLMRVNASKTEYSATLAPLGVSGEFPLHVLIFDYKTSNIAYTEGIIISKINSLRPHSESTGFSTYILGLISKISRSYLLWFIILLVTLAYIGRRLMHTEW